jgi:alcohol dehydrogenase class IV
MRLARRSVPIEVVKQMGIKRTLILTHRPVVNEGWFHDFKKIFSGRNMTFFNYGSKDSG